VVMTSTDLRRRAAAPAPPAPPPDRLIAGEPAVEPAPRATRGMDEQLRRRELAAFLRSRRERLTPADVGLPPGGRRRTPGLRREEVASLAGVGMTWYTWLEQGRDINASDQVLDAIARTLMLDPHERTHLFTLAGLTPTGPIADLDAVSPEVRAMLDQLHPFPAFVSNARYDLLAYNRAYQTLIGDLDAVPFEDRNTLLLIFTKHTTSKCFVDRDEAKPRLVAQLRSAMAEHVADPAWKCLVRRLREASPEFAEIWQRHEVAQPENARKRLLHADFGLLQFNYINTWLAPRTGVRLVTYIPADEATHAAVREFDTVAPRPIR
jgi:transcriptional regulator with XRE-family HTH domain